MKNAVLERFKQYIELEEKHQATNRFENGVDLVPTVYAKHRNYIQLNQYTRPYFNIDIDRATNKIELCKDLSLPEPTIICYTKESRKAHCFWELKTPVSYQPHSRKKPQKLFEVIEQDLIILADADPQFTTAKNLTKNPLSKNWDVELFDKQYELKDFLSITPTLNKTYLDKFVQNIGKATAENSRDCFVFEIVRHKGYRAVHQYSSKSDFCKFILNECQVANPEASAILGKPLLPGKEVRKIAKSISDWTWKNKHKIDGKNRGVMGFEPSKRVDETLLALEEKEIKYRQQQGAIYTNTLRSNNTMEKITNAIKVLGSNATKQQIAEYTNISYRTILRYL